MGQLTAALRWLQTCAFPVESGGGRWNSESPIDVGAGRPWLGGLRRWLPGFVAVGLPAARHPPPGPGFSPIE